MKWFNVKKYEPAHGLTDVFVRTSVEVFYSAYNEIMDDGSIIWRGSFGDESVIANVTHFCIPAPIEIE